MLFAMGYVSHCGLNFQCVARDTLNSMTGICSISVPIGHSLGLSAISLNSSYVPTKSHFFRTSKLDWRKRASFPMTRSRMSVKLPPLSTFETENWRATLELLFRAVQHCFQGVNICILGWPSDGFFGETLPNRPENFALGLLAWVPGLCLVGLPFKTTRQPAPEMRLTPPRKHYCTAWSMRDGGVDGDRLGCEGRAHTKEASSRVHHPIPLHLETKRQAALFLVVWHRPRHLRFILATLPSERKVLRWNVWYVV